MRLARRNEGLRARAARSCLRDPQGHAHVVLFAVAVGDAVGPATERDIVGCHRDVDDPSRQGVSMRLRSIRVLTFAALGPLVVPSTARAQDLFAPNTVDAEASAAPEPAPASPTPIAADAVEWWRAKQRPLRPRPPPKPLALRLDGAYAPRRLFTLGVTGADLGLALGVQTSQHTAWWAASRVSLGSTENGLSVWSGRAGAEVEGVFDPVRFGVGASFLFMGVDRATRNESLMSYGVEVRAFGRFDFVRNDDYALFLRAGIDAGAEARGESTFWGPALGIGVELGVRGKRPEAWTASGATTPRSF